MNSTMVLQSIAGLAAADLERWIALGWVTPATAGAPDHFTIVDVARVQLIHDLSADLAIDDDTVPVVLSLVDQLYAVRRRLARVLAAVDGEPADIRQRIIAVIIDADDARER